MTFKVGFKLSLEIASNCLYLARNNWTNTVGSVTTVAKLIEAGSWACIINIFTTVTFAVPARVFVTVTSLTPYSKGLVTDGII
jgi:hypothetical protein